MTDLEVPQLHDWNGAPIAEGVRVLYSTHCGNSTEIRLGVVLVVDEEEYRVWDRTTRSYTTAVRPRVKIRSEFGTQSGPASGGIAFPTVSNLTVWPFGGSNA